MGRDLPQLNNAPRAARFGARHRAIAFSYGHTRCEALRAPVPPSPASVSQITQSPRFPGLRFHLLVADLDSGRVVMGNGYLRAAPEKNPGPPTRQSAVCGEDVIYVSMCSGGVIIKISAADRPKFVLGQLIIFGAIVVVALVELTLWLVNVVGWA